MNLDKYFYELFEGLPRQGPGDNESTRKALSMMRPLPGAVNVLDIGCGSGMQTIELAKHINGTITALDNHQPFLDELDRRVSREGLTDKIRTVNGSMFSLDFAKGSFDVIWCEGAIFIIGFEAGLEAFKPLLKPGGYMAVSELCWTKDDPPREIAAYFEAIYPAIMAVTGNFESIARAGYELIGSFTQPESVWWNSYFGPVEAQMERMRQKYPGNARVDELYDETQQEIDMYRRYAEYYGNAFFVMRKAG